LRGADLHASLHRSNPRPCTKVVQYGDLRQSSKTGRAPEARSESTKGSPEGAAGVMSFTCVLLVSLTFILAALHRVARLDGPMAAGHWAASASAVLHLPLRCPLATLVFVESCVGRHGSAGVPGVAGAGAWWAPIVGGCTGAPRPSCGHHPAGHVGELCAVRHQPHQGDESGVG
jgi:hypothetical protein